MKAIKKAYGNKEWEDTPLSRHYFNEIGAARAVSRMHAASIVAVGQYSMDNIRHSDSVNSVKAIDIGQVAADTIRGVNTVLARCKESIDTIKIKYGVSV